MKLSGQQVCQNVYGFAQAQPLFPATPCIDAVVTSRTREPSLTSTPLFRSGVHGEGCMSYGMPMMLSRSPSKSSSGSPRSIPPPVHPQLPSTLQQHPRFPESPSLCLCSIPLFLLLSPFSSSCCAVPFCSVPFRPHLLRRSHTLVTSARRPSNNPHRPLASSDSHLRPPP